VDSTGIEDRGKTHRTACVVIPPEEVWGQIQAIRRVHDPMVARWMPHVTLLYPFVPESRFAEAVERLRPAAEAVAAFEVSLGGFGCFVHGRRSATVWVRPEPAEALCRLQAALAGAMPWCDDVGRFAGGFTPHLSVGRFRGRGAAERAMGELAAGWQAVGFWVREVSLIARSGRPGEPFAARATLGLQGV